ncbi:MAG TPA: hypothetical protein VK479_05840 [Micropepsaceae bacterium]|nr:hypothetical protein [Micropepsaceae bacterium]
MLAAARGILTRFSRSRFAGDRNKKFIVVGSFFDRRHDRFRVRNTPISRFDIIGLGLKGTPLAFPRNLEKRIPMYSGGEYSSTPSVMSQSTILLVRPFEG